MKFNCSFSTLLDIFNVKPNPNNPNNHPPEQIERLAEIIKYQGQRSPIVISNRSGLITKGHGRLEAMKKLGWDQVAVDFQDYEDEAQEYADIVADNAIALWADLQYSKINVDIADLGPELNIDMLGIKDFKVDVSEIEEENSYTRKIESPIYEPRGEKPPVVQLFDKEKLDKLIAEIDHHENLPSEVRIFLKFAAHRHIKFNYKLIAEYYAHASPVIQDLMEKSALVIIDFEKAIESGFVKLNDELKEAYLSEQ